MVGEWREVRLADIADITSGKRPPLIVEQAKAELTVPVLGGSGVMGFTSKPLFEEPVLVTGRVGTLGMLHRTSGPSWPSDNTLVVRAKEDLVVESFLYYALLDCIGQARSLNRGSSNPLVTQQDIGSLKLPLPPFPEQRAISYILGTLDDKIELNRRMSETLEAMARALFKAWFVDFEPVRAKMEGRWQRGQSLPGLPAHLYDLFPDRLVDSELGEIPEGWEVARVDDLCARVENGGTPSRMEPIYWGGSIPWFKTGELTDGPLLASEETITEEGLSSSSCKLWPIGTILIALYASPTVGRLGILEVPAAANQACSALLARPEYGNLFLFYTLLATRERLQQIAVGAAQQNISQQAVRDHKVIVPPAAIARAFHDSAEALYRRRVGLISESRTLAALRDALLPKLIRGEIRVKDAERFLKERGL